MYTPPRPRDTMADAPQEGDAALQAPLLARQGPSSESEQPRQAATPSSGAQAPGAAARTHATMTNTSMTNVAMSNMMVPATGIPQGDSFTPDHPLAWVPGSEVLLANVQLPEHLPDAMARWEDISPLMMGWMVSSVASLAMAFVFGFFAAYGIFGLAAGIVGVVGASLHICRCCSNIAVAAKNVRVLGWVALGLDCLAMIIAAVINILVHDSDYVHFLRVTSLLSCMLMAAHAGISLWVARSVMPILAMFDPVSSGLVTVA